MPSISRRRPICRLGESLFALAAVALDQLLPREHAHRLRELHHYRAVVHLHATRGPPALDFEGFKAEGQPRRARHTG